MAELIAFVRVSGKAQSDNTSREYQLSQIRQYSELYGHALVSVIDTIETGYHIAQRKEFRRALQMLKAGQAEGVIFANISRFSRSVSAGAILLDAFERNNWHLITVQERLDTSGPMGRFMFLQFLLQSEFERNVIVKRFADGRAERKRRGEYSNGQLSYGWKGKAGGVIEQIPQEQEILKLIFDNRGLGATRIAELLNLKGYTTRKGTAFGERQVRRILQGPRPGEDYQIA